MSLTQLFVIVFVYPFIRCLAIGIGDTSIGTLATTISNEWTDDGVIENDDNQRTARWIVYPPAVNAQVTEIDEHYFHGPYNTDQTMIYRSFYCHQPSAVSVSFNVVACGTILETDRLKFYFNGVMKAKASTIESIFENGSILKHTLSQATSCAIWNNLGSYTINDLAVPDASQPFTIKFQIYLPVTAVGGATVSTSRSDAWFAVMLNYITCDPFTTTTSPETTHEVDVPPTNTTEPTTTEAAERDTTKTEMITTEALTTTEVTTTEAVTTTDVTTTETSTTSKTSTTSEVSTTSKASTATMMRTTEAQTTTATTEPTTKTNTRPSKPRTSSTTTATTANTVTEPSTTTTTTSTTEGTTTSTTTTSTTDDTTSSTQNNNEGEVKEISSTEPDSNEVKSGQSSGRSQEMETGIISGLTKGPNLIYSIIGAGAFVIICVLIFVYCRVQRNKSAAKEIQFNIEKDIEADIDNVPKESASSKDMHRVAPPAANAAVQLQMEFNQSTFSNPSYPNMAVSLQSNPEVFNQALGNLNAVNDVLMDDIINDMEEKPTVGAEDAEEGDYVTKGGDYDEEDPQPQNAESVDEGDAYAEDMIAGPETTGGRVYVDKNDDDDEYVPAPPKPPSDGIALPQVTGGVSMATAGWNADEEEDECVAPPPVPPVADDGEMHDDEEEPDMIAAPETTGGGTRGYCEQNGEDDNTPPAPPVPPV